jgi:hypothetical protein
VKHGNPRFWQLLSQGQAFVGIGHEKQAATGAPQSWRYFCHANAVGVCLDHGCRFAISFQPRA